MVALYTYDPDLDSPNEFPELELGFLEGDLIRVGLLEFSIEMISHLHDLS